MAFSKLNAICFSYSLRYNASLDDMKKDQNITDERDWARNTAKDKDVT